MTRIRFKYDTIRDSYLSSGQGQRSDYEATTCANEYKGFANALQLAIANERSILRGMMRPMVDKSGDEVRNEIDDEGKLRQNVRGNEIGKGQSGSVMTGTK